MTIEPVLEVFGKFLSDNSFISPADTARIIKEWFAFPEEQAKVIHFQLEQHS